MERETDLRRYLLGVLTPEERAQVEEKLFLDREFFQLLQSTEDDLIDEYVSGELSAEEREQFESAPLSGFERRTDLRIAKALQKYIATEAEPETFTLEDDPAPSVPVPAPPTLSFIPRPRWRPAVSPRLALAAVVIVAAVIGLWLILRDGRRSEHPPPSQARLSETPGEDVGGKSESNLNVSIEPPTGNSGSAVDSGGANPVQNLSNSTPERGRDPAGPKRNTNNAPATRPMRGLSGRTYAATLLPVGVVRGDGGAENRIIIPTNVDYVMLRLPMLTQTDYSTYEATLATEEGASIKMWTGLRPTGAKVARSINLPSVPVTFLSPQKYRLELRGGDRQGNFTTIYTYHFQVAPR